MTIPTLVTARLILRPTEAGDLDALAAIRADDRVARFTGGTRTRHDVWMAMLRTHGLWAMLGYGYWTAQRRKSDEIVGEVGFADFMRGIEPDISGTPEAGWIIAPSAWGQGFATEAVSAIHHWLDDARPCRTTCIISPENHASIRIAEKHGYRKFADSDIKGDAISVYERDSRVTRKS